MNKPKLKLPGSVSLVSAFMIGNLLNFLFNAVLGRALSFEQFGQFTLFSTLWAVIGIFLGAFGGSINHRVSYLFTINKGRARHFYQSVLVRGAVTGTISIVFLCLLAYPIAIFFNISDPREILLFSPAIVVGILLAAGRGYLQGSLQFHLVALLVILEPVTKLLIASIFAAVGLRDSIYLSIPLSITITLVVFFLLIKRNVPKKQSVSTSRDAFPTAFFSASILSGFSTYAFATFDVLLAKHFLSQTLAGEYAILSLVGKMVFFFGSILNGFIITYVSRDAGLKRKTRNVFNILLLANVFLTLSSFVALGPLGHLIVPALLGTKAFAIVPYLTTYTLATALFTIGNSLVIYHLAKKQYFFSVISVLMALFMIIGIFISHNGIADIVNVFLGISFISFCTIALMHFVFDYGKYFVRSVVDFMDLFDPLPQTIKTAKDKKKILVFNWRDIKHINAGGAETYIHEISRRWVSDGHHVTLFCGNDSESKRYELVDGVEVIRRGGFYFVYVWAFLYYMLQFRGKYDIVIDCQNGVPFFTPLYVKEPVYAVVYHIHQKVFSQFLDKTSAFVASSIEKYVMPWAYRHAQFITISESTKKEMLKLGIRGKNIEIVYCGVDLSNLRPGKKSKVPTVLYLGRLKAYKSVDVLLKAFKAVAVRFPEAKLVIAGSGDEEENLKKLAQKLQIQDKVSFKGKVTEDEKVALLQKAWVFVNPSMQEGWGMTTIEANACATPVIASDVPGLRDSVNNPHTGYLVKYGDVNAFANTINELIRNKQKFKKMIKESSKWAKQFTWSQSASQFAGLL